MGWNPKKHAEDIGGKVTGNIVEDAKMSVENLGKDISTSAKTAGASIKNASDTSIGDPVANAWKTSVLDPTNKAAKQAKELAAKWGGTAEDWFNKMNKTKSTGFDPSAIQMIPTTGVPGGGMGGGQGSPVQIATGGGAGTAGVIDNQFRTGQLTLAQQLAAQASGQGPSLATEQLKQSQQANQAAIFAQLASARGGSNPALARQAMQTSANIQGQTARDAATARIQEQMGAREQLGAVLGTGRQGDLTSQSQSNEIAIQNAQLAQAAQELQAKYAAMGLDAQKANQYASIEMQKLLAGVQTQPSQLAQGAGILSSIMGSYVGS